MPGKRERLARVLDAVGINAALTRIRAHAPPTWLSVLTYHRVGEPTGAPVADDMFDAGESQFDEQIRYLARHFNFVSTDDVIAMLDGRPLPPNPVMVTFDDGYIDNLEKVVPILKRHGASATFFIPTDYIEQRRMFWWDRISLIVGRCERDDISLTYPKEVSLPRTGAVRKLCDIVKTTHGMDLERFLDELLAACGVTWDADEEQRIVDDLLMTWDQIRELLGAGMDVQSHTCSHRVVQTLEDADLERELRGSREKLERELGRSVLGLAYPVGYPIAGQSRIRRAVSEAGYRVAFSNQTGPIPRWGKVDALDLNRMAAYPEASSELFRAMMAMPLLSPTDRTPPRPITG